MQLLGGERQAMSDELFTGAGSMDGQAAVSRKKQRQNTARPSPWGVMDRSVNGHDIPRLSFICSSTRLFVHSHSLQHWSVGGPTDLGEL